MQTRLLILLTAIPLACCAAVAIPTNVNVQSAGNLDLPQVEKIPGRFVAVIETTGLTKTFDLEGSFGIYCSYPIDANRAFKQAAETTLRSMFENVEVSTDALPDTTLRSRNLDGQILLKVNSFDPELSYEDPRADSI